MLAAYLQPTIIFLFAAGYYRYTPLFLYALQHDLLVRFMGMCSYALLKALPPLALRTYSTAGTCI